MTDLTVPLPADLEADTDLLAKLAGAWLLSYRSEHTRGAYRRDLHAFLGWCEERGADPWAVRRVHLDAWARAMEAEGYASSTIARRLSAVSSFYEYAADEGQVERNPVAKVRRPKVERDAPEGLTRDQSVALLHAASEDARDASVVGLLLLLGLRASEVAALDVDDLGTERGHVTLRVSGKGETTATMPVPPRLADAIERHLDGRTSGPLVLGNDGARLDRHRVARIIARVARAAGIEGTVRPHQLRHAMVTHALAAGVELHRVQDAARHSDPRTTRRYDRAAQALDGHASYTLSAYLA